MSTILRSVSITEVSPPFRTPALPSCSGLIHRLLYLIGPIDPAFQLVPDPSHLPLPQTFLWTQSLRCAISPTFRTNQSWNLDPSVPSEQCDDGIPRRSPSFSPVRKAAILEHIQRMHRYCLMVRYLSASTWERYRFRPSYLGAAGEPMTLKLERGHCDGATLSSPYCRQPIGRRGRHLIRLVPGVIDGLPWADLV